MYFEAVTKLGLIHGLIVVKMVQPGAGANANAATLDTRSIPQYTSSARATHTVEFSPDIIRDGVDAFAKRAILPVC